MEVPVGEALQHVVLVSLEPWDEVWRRNQHFASRLVRKALVERLTFLAPPSRHPPLPFSPERGVCVVTPMLRTPKRLGGLAFAALGVRSVVREASLLWINDAEVGRHLLRRDQPALYDVTDDWRTSATLPRVRRRLIRAENLLSRRALTVTCSEVLQERWRTRYGTHALLVRNGVDLEGVRLATGRRLAGPHPHVGYVGTLHDERLDIALVLRVADLPEVGKLHLIGPDCLEPSSRASLVQHPKIVLHAAVATSEVPGWLRGLDVLICPHRVTPFTLSLDAIKSHEYLASGRPIVATATSGFQHLAAPGLWVAGGDDLPSQVVLAIKGATEFGPRGAVDWGERVLDFAKALRSAGQGGGQE